MLNGTNRFQRRQISATFVARETCSFAVQIFETINLCVGMHHRHHRVSVLQFFRIFIQQRFQSVLSFGTHPITLIDQHHFGRIVTQRIHAFVQTISTHTLHGRFDAVDGGRLLQPRAFIVFNQRCRTVDDATWWIARWKTVCTGEADRLIQIVIDWYGCVQRCNRDVIRFQ